MIYGMQYHKWPLVNLATRQRTMYSMLVFYTCRPQKALLNNPQSHLTGLFSGIDLYIDKF